MDPPACAEDQKLDTFGLRSFLNGSEGIRGSGAAELSQERNPQRLSMAYRGLTLSGSIST